MPTFLSWPVSSDPGRPVQITFKSVVDARGDRGKHQFSKDSLCSEFETVLEAAMHQASKLNAP